MDQPTIDDVASTLPVQPGEVWLEPLDDRLQPQADLLRRLLHAVQTDSQWRWLELSCSLARGTADRWSDIDIGIGAADSAWPSCCTDIRPLLAELGDVIGSLHHRIDSWGERQHQRSFVQYASGVQLDLVIMPASERTGLPPGSIALYDPDHLLSAALQLSVLHATQDDLREWAFQGWIALADMAKYLERGSAWEAMQRLDECRTQIWRLWAALREVPYPLFGLTAVLDFPDAGTPTDIEATVATLDAVALCRAAVACCSTLQRTAEQALGHRIDQSNGLARYVQQRINDVARRLEEQQVSVSHSLN